MDEFQKCFNEIDVRKQNLQFNHTSKKDLLEFWKKKENQFIDTFKEYINKNFITQENAAEKLNDMHKRLCLLKSSMFPMEYVLKELEKLRNEIAQLDNFVWVDRDAPDIQVGELHSIFRVTKRGEKWEDKDIIIHNLKQQCFAFVQAGQDHITECHRLNDQMKDKDRLIHNMKQEMEDMKRKLNMYSQSGYLVNQEFKPPYSNVAVPQLQPIYTSSYQPEEYQDLKQHSVCDTCTKQGITQLQSDNARLQRELAQSKQMILKMEREAQTREEDLDRLERDLTSSREELEQTKADQEKNQGKQVYVNNFYGPALNLLNYSSQDNALQLGNQNWMTKSAENVQQNQWQCQN